MATRAFTRLPKSLPSDLLRGGLPQLGRFGAGSCHRRPGESREDDRYARAQDLVAQTRSIHLTRRNESTVLIAGAGIAASAMIARYGIKEYRKYQVGFSQEGVAKPCALPFFVYRGLASRLSVYTFFRAPATHYQGCSCRVVGFPRRPHRHEVLEIPRDESREHMHRDVDHCAHTSIPSRSCSHRFESDHVELYIPNFLSRVQRYISRSESFQTSNTRHSG